MVPLNCAVSERVVRGGLGHVCSSSLHTELYNILTQQTWPSPPRTTLSDVESSLLEGCYIESFVYYVTRTVHRTSTPWGYRLYVNVIVRGHRLHRAKRISYNLRVRVFPTPVLHRIEVDSMQLHEMCMGITSILQA